MSLRVCLRRRVHNRRKGDVEHLTIFPEAMLEVLKSEDSERDVCMTMAVFPQELLTLVAFPEHAAPYYSSISVTFGPVRCGGGGGERLTSLSVVAVVDVDFVVVNV